jgi:hypothetical protein
MYKKAAGGVTRQGRRRISSPVVANFARVLRLVYGVIFYAARTSTCTALLSKG